MRNLVIDGKTYAPKKITMKMWRELCEWDEKERTGEVELSQRIATYAEIIASVYGVPVDELENIAAEEFIPIYRECAEYVFHAAFSRLDKIPNAAAAKEPQN